MQHFQDTAPGYEMPLARRRLTRAGAAFIGLHVVTWLAALAQGFIDSDYDNLICTAFVLCSASLTFLYVRLTRALRDLPFSTVAVLGLCVTTQWGALIGQSALGDSLTANLRVPLQTFGYLFGFQMVAIAAHWVTRHFAFFAAARRAVSEGLLRPLGIFQVPPVQAMWAIGCVGLLAVFAAQGSEGGLLGKIAAGFGVLAWAPFVIPILAMRHGAAYCRMARQVPLLALFGGLAVLMGLAFNFRSVMLVGAMTGALLYALVVLDDNRPFELRQVRNLAILAVAGALLYQPVSYFLTAFQVAREQRDKISKVEMIAHTIEVLKNPAAIRRENDRMVIDAEVSAYDEFYFKSSMLGRLVETKFHDNAFYMVQGTSPLESRLIAEDALDRVYAILPYPVLRWMGMGRAKFVTLYSVGDYLAYLRLGGDIGQFRTGSMFAQAIAIFGIWTPFLYFLLCLPVFMVWDVLSRSGGAGTRAVTSVIGMLLIYRLFAFGIVTESIGNIAGLLLRFQLQTVLLYALVFAATRLLWKPFEPNLVRPGDPATSVGMKTSKPAFRRPLAR
ncbi:conserved membrane hypothetical protein [Rubrivivax sp. A210]|uniref:hypothetical protein n=1 Tax=Rubrivivax sp. A210 TaxID=2772301 RepID=UPI001919C678|nr:hypothetical protein [Rubrivivax sp. A210]CAD5369186.1 conserved membrane hypothetical protein [Rubrivivax sp. A210]